MNRKIGFSTTLAACVALLLAGALRTRAADSENEKKAPDADKHFAMHAAHGGLAEVQLGKLAEANAASEEVKKFGQRMVEDHTKANAQLATIAQSEGLTVPTELHGKHKEMYEHLAALKGAEFDKAYMQHMVQDHVEDVESFTTEANKGQDPQLKAFATQTLPVLRTHLELANKVAPTVGAERAKQSDASDPIRTGPKH